MRQILILSWFLITMPHVHASTCEAAIAGAQQLVVIKHIQKLNPQILSDSNTAADWSSLYVVLKTEESRFAAGQPLDPRIKELIQENQARQYDLSQFTDNEFRQFYLNALRSLYVRVAAFWTEQELARLNGEAVTSGVAPASLHPDVMKIASRILEGTISPWTLKDRELLPVDAAAYFKAQEWKKLPWKNIFAFIAAWKKHSPYTYSYSEFAKFWTDNATAFQLEYSLFGPLQLAFSGHETSLFCCLSEPGCVNCPHNRRWLK